MTEISEIIPSSRHRYQMVLDNALDAVIVIDGQSRIVEWSDQAQALFGWSAQEAMGKTLADTLLPQNGASSVNRRQGGTFSSARGKVEAGRRIEVEARHKDGKSIPLTFSLLPLQAGDQAKDGVGESSEWRQLEIVLQRQANLTRLIIDNMADAILVADINGRLVIANPAARALFGIQAVGASDATSVCGLPLLEEDGATPIAGDHQPVCVALDGRLVHQRFVLVRAAYSAAPIPVSINATPLFDNEGQSLGAVAVFHDITEQKQREAALTQQAQRLSQQADLLNLVRDAIIVRMLPEDTISYWNKGAERLYKFRSDQAIGRVSHELLATQFPIPLNEILNTAQQQGYWEGELTQATADGRHITVHSQWVLDYQDGRAARFLESATDITQRVQAEKALRQSQQNYELLVESSTDYAIMMLSPDGKIESWNSGAEKVLGYAAEEAIGRHMDMLFTPEDRSRGMPQRELERARQEGRADNGGWRLRRDDSKFWAAGITTPTWHSDGSLRGFAKIMRDLTAQRLAEEQTHFLANHDALTGLPNRVRFSDELHQAIALCERNRTKFALLVLDLDRFKYVNDTFGHHTGDLLLKEVSLRIRGTLRETDFVARLGGDEFVVIQREDTQPQAAEALASKLVKQLGQPYLLEAAEVISGSSVGIAIYPGDASNSVELLKRADLALYRAKHAGRHNFQFYTSELAAELASREDRAQALRQALQNQQFELYYQPQIDLNDWKIATVEALLRWHASELDLLPPRDFLGVAEESGVIVEIGVWALREACMQVRRWQQQGLPELRISVNCSARQFGDPEFVAMVPRILDEAGLTPSLLELEVPESLLAQRPEIKGQLAALRSLGIRITIDNFGTGNTALKELQGLEVDALKIDKAFVRHLPHRREDSAIASAIIGLARNLGIGVVAGGVETAEQLAYLKSRDCQSAQGFIFSPPVTADEFEALMLNGNWSQLNRWSALGGTEGMGSLH
jgi:diguanylate cyclase (GGDEF)-like protein/PAS domain S-box-containing protein